METALMEWSYLTTPIAITVILFFVPGLLVTLAARQKGFDAVGPAPAISVAIIALSAILAPKLGRSWSIWIPLSVTIVVAALVGVAFFFYEKYSISMRLRSKKILNSPVTQPLEKQSWFSLDNIWYYAAFILSICIMTGMIKSTVSNPDWISQSFDGNFHLNAIRYIMDTGNGSSLFVGGMGNSEGTPLYYPAAWHDIAALVATHAGNASIFNVANIMSLVISAYVWPASALYLVRSVFKFNGAGVIAAGAALTGFTAFPVMLMDWGVLYPNMLGVALLPAGIALAGMALHVFSVRRVNTVASAVLGVIALIGIALAHPNAVMSALVILIPALIIRILISIKLFATRQSSAVSALGTIIVMAAALGIVRYLWDVVRPDGGGIWDPTLTESAAYGEALMNAPMGRGVPMFVTVLMFGGILVLFMLKNRNIWLFFAWAYCVFLFAAARWLPWDEGREFTTGIWYNDAYRISAVIPMLAVVFCAFAVHYIASLILDFAPLHKLFARLSSPKIAHTVLALVLAVISGWVVTANATTSKALTQNLTEVNGRYNFQNNPDLLSANELAMFSQLNQYVPEDDTIIVQPNTGAALAYAYTGRHVTERHIFFDANDEVTTINHELNKAKSDPKVCQAVKDMKAYYYLDFGTHEVFHGDHKEPYRGLLNIGSSGVAKKVVEIAPDVVLYQITACGPVE